MTTIKEVDTKDIQYDSKPSNFASLQWEFQSVNNDLNQLKMRDEQIQIDIPTIIYKG